MLLCGSPARAEQDTDAAARAAARDEAQAWFVKARADFDGKRYARALEALRQAHKLQRLPLLLRYMGDCHFELGDFEPAISHYRRYLNRGPEAADHGDVERRLAEAERLAREQRTLETGGRKVPARLMPTGKDRENPIRPWKAATPTSSGGTDDRRTTWLAVSKWSTLAVAVAGLATGVTFNRLAASKANDLRQSIRTACPPGAPGCAGNPDLNTPVVSYSLEHYELQRQLKRNNTIAVTSFILGGVAAAGSAVMFWLDRPARAQASRASVAPLLGAGNLGVAGEVSF